MTLTCLNLCNKIKETPKTNNIYSSGFKRCRFCEVYLKTNEVRCPCCKTLLAYRPRQHNDHSEFRRSFTRI